MRSLIFILILLMCSIPLVAENILTNKNYSNQSLLLKEFAFRGLKFGMSLKQVKNIEKSKLTLKQDNVLAYKINVMGYPSFMAHYFHENKYYRTMITFKNINTEARKYIFDYDDIKTKLIDKYGPPKEDNVIWLNELFKNDPSGWGTALALGQLNYLTSWVFENISIDLYMAGENYNVATILKYQNDDLAAEAKKKEDEKRKDDY